jgi:hypothetical protein
MEFREKPHTDKYKGITNDSIYVASCTSTSPPVWDLEYFDGLIFVAQNVQYAVSPIIKPVALDGCAARRQCADGCAARRQCADGL